MSSFVFQNSDPLQSSSLHVSLSILFSQPGIISHLSTARPCILHPSTCIISQTILLSKSHPHLPSSTMTQLLTCLSTIHSTDTTEADPDPINILSTILVNFHCYSITGKCLDNEHTIQKSCSGKCLLHQYFFLGVNEKVSCKCGRNWENPWDSHNICQYFNVSGLFEDFEEGVSKVVAQLPKYRFKNSQVTGNSEGFQRKLVRLLGSKLRNVTHDACENDRCTVAEVSIKFLVSNAPVLFIIDLVYDSHSIKHLESYLCTISIQSTLKLKDLYHDSPPLEYGLLGVVFFGKEFAFASFKNGFWVFPGLHEEAVWYELVQEALVMNLHPVALVYKKGETTQELNLESYKLLRLEQSAVQCDLFVENYKSDVVSQGFVSSGLFVEKKNRRKDFSVENKDLRRKNRGEDRMEEIGVEAGWKCQCGKWNLEDFDVCTMCSTMRAGVSGWLCSKCCLRNDEFSLICAACFEIKSSEQRFTAEDIKMRPDDNFVNEKKGIWKCACLEENSEDFEVCQKCYKLQPGAKGWVCQACKCKNSETDYLCAVCQATKSGATVPDQEFWVCEKCRTAVSTKFSFCDSCYESRNKARSFLTSPKKLTECPKCGKNSPMSSKKCYWCQEPLSEPAISQLLPGLGYLSTSLTSPLKKSNLGEKTENWRCKDCGMENEIESLIFCKCRGRKKRDEDVEKTWNCAGCQKRNYSFAETCLFCKRLKKYSGLEEGNKEKWKCQRCSEMNEEWRQICKSCFRNKSGDENGWSCRNCSRRSLESEYICMYCGEARNSLFSEEKCIRCNKRLEIVDCPRCKKRTSFSNKFCNGCNGSLENVKICSLCSLYTFEVPEKQTSRYTSN